MTKSQRAKEDGEHYVAYDDGFKDGVEAVGRNITETSLSLKGHNAWKRRSRDELVRDIEKMVALRNDNKTYRQIATIMGYKSPGTVSDLLRKRGHVSVVLSTLEVTFLINLLKAKPENKFLKILLGKLTKVVSN